MTTGFSGVILTEATPAFHSCWAEKTPSGMNNKEHISETIASIFIIAVAVFRTDIFSLRPVGCRGRVAQIMPRLSGWGEATDEPGKGRNDWEGSPGVSPHRLASRRSRGRSPHPCKAASTADQVGRGY